MKLKNNNISVEINDQNGATSAIRYVPDQSQMNWILENPLWGTVPDFDFIEMSKTDNGIKAVYEHPKKLSRVTVKKSVNDTDYFEKYIIENIGISEYFLTKDNFGILMPTNSNYKKGEKIMNKCVSHIWCGDNVCWMYSARTNGSKPYLVMDLTEGSIVDYSIDYDYSLTNLGADWRGAFLLHPKECVINPNESITLNFRFRFSDITPESALLDFNGAMRFTASKYSPYTDEKIKLTLEYNGKLDDAVIKCGETSFPHVVKNGIIECEVSFESIGEREITATVDGKETYLRIKVLESLADILEKRAHFIAEKQQYHKDGSHLDGAYLIYDSETEKQYYGRIDHNAGRERIGMGVTVCRALQIKYSETLMESLKKHRKFIERELFDVETGMVYNDVNKDNTHFRHYNFPWFITYYNEWYKLTKEKQCLLNAVNILLTLYNEGGQNYDATMFEIVELINSLKNEKLYDLSELLIGKFASHMDTLIKNSGLSTSKEVTLEHGKYDLTCYFLSQAYILTNDEKYLIAAKQFNSLSEMFFARQPDFHLNCIPLRYWDDYWFGKLNTYGDIFPHYWSSVSSCKYYWFDKALQNQAHNKEIETNLKGNLCIYDSNGFAANCYLYPYKINMYSSNPLYKNQFMKTATTYGKQYDPWANDQDWVLYYASIYLENEF